MITLEQFRAKAYEVFTSEKSSVIHTDPLSYLYSLEWNIPRGPAFSEKKMAEMNIGFDERGCMGRSIKAAVLLEINFPNELFYMGEVCEDYLAHMLITTATPDEWSDNTYIAEILQNEAPHSVIIWKSFHFDALLPLFSSDPKSLVHPSVIKHDLWKGLHAAYLVSVCVDLFLQKKDMSRYIDDLKKIVTMYPHIILVKSNLAAALMEASFYMEGIMLAKTIIDKRKDVRLLWLLWKITKDISYKNKLLRDYGNAMFNYLNKQV